ncbi:hypothetical protein HY988_03230 [Candidatus Micrarchaeota archaeon]|nr:hypothetical protein [Candidatus Micrarchaeota archaeon]
MVLPEGPESLIEDAKTVPAEIVYPSGAKLKITPSWSPPKQHPNFSTPKGHSLSYYPLGSEKPIEFSDLFPLSNVRHTFRLLEDGKHSTHLEISRLSETRREFNVSEDLPQASWHEILCVLSRLQKDERHIFPVFHEIGHVCCELIIKHLVEAGTIGNYDFIPKGLRIYARVVEAAHQQMVNRIEKRTGHKPTDQFSGLRKGLMTVAIFGSAGHGNGEFGKVFAERTAWAFALRLKRQLNLSLGFRNKKETIDFLTQALSTYSDAYGISFTKPLSSLSLTELQKCFGEGIAAETVFSALERINNLLEQRGGTHGA